MLQLFIDKLQMYKIKAGADELEPRREEKEDGIICPIVTPAQRTKGGGEVCPIVTSDGGNQSRREMLDESPKVIFRLQQCVTSVQKHSLEANCETAPSW